MICFENGEIQSSPKCLNDTQTIIFCTKEEIPVAMNAVNFKASDKFSFISQYGSQFESNREFSKFTLERTELLPSRANSSVGALFNSMRLIIVHNKSEGIDDLIDDIEKDEVACEIIPVLENLFNSIMTDDENLLQDIENSLLELEERIISDNLSDCVSEIMQLRKTLLLFNRYYDGFFHVLQGLEENQNDYFQERSLNIFSILINRVNHIDASIASLRDYAAQVREAYQNQIDIDLNQTMKLFTVITAIFLPLTLLAGWYGMNFNMPEYTVNWTYPLFIAVSAAIIVCMLVYFKRKKWF